MAAGGWAVRVVGVSCGGFLSCSPFGSGERSQDWQGDVEAVIACVDFEI